MMYMRDVSGWINEHALVTKDKLADVELRLYILNVGCTMISDSLKEPTKYIKRW